MYYIIRNIFITIVATISTAHLISGTLATMLMKKSNKKVNRNEIIMTVIAVIVSNIQTIYLAKQINKNK